MNSATQVIADISSLSIAVALIVGVILGSIALFRIATALKYRNQMLEQATRPYLFCQRTRQQLEVRNDGTTPITIDKVTGDIDLSTLNGQKLAAHQSIFFNSIPENQPLLLKFSYHDELRNYHDDFKF